MITILKATKITIPKGLNFCFGFFPFFWFSNWIRFYDSLHYYNIYWAASFRFSFESFPVSEIQNVLSESHSIDGMCNARGTFLNYKFSDERLNEWEREKCASEWNLKVKHNYFGHCNCTRAIWNKNTFHCCSFIPSFFRFFFVFSRSGCVWAAFRRIRFDLYPYRCSYILAFRRHLKAIRYSLLQSIFFFFISSFYINRIFHYERENFANDYQLNISQLQFWWCATVAVVMAAAVMGVCFRLIACEKYCVHLFPSYIFSLSLFLWVSRSAFSFSICVRRKSTSSKNISLLSIGKSLSIPILNVFSCSSIQTIERKAFKQTEKKKLSLFSFGFNQ